MLCPSCGDDANPPGAKFCEGCGASLDGCGAASHARLPVRNARPRRRRLLPDLRPEAGQDLRRRGVGTGLRRRAGARLGQGAQASDQPGFWPRRAARRRRDAHCHRRRRLGLRQSRRRLHAPPRKRSRRRSSRASAPEAPLSAEAAALALEAAEAVHRDADRRATVNDGPASTIVIALARENAASGALDVGDRLGRRQPRLSRRRQRAGNPADARQFLGGGQDRIRRVFARGGDAFALRATPSPNGSACRAPKWSIHAKDAVLTRGVGPACLQRRSLEIRRRPRRARPRLHRRGARRPADAATICRALVAFANAAGGGDNITVGLLRA